MPELPEVETTVRGIAPHLEGRTVTGVVVRNPSLRWPVPDDLEQRLQGQTLERIRRRAKYLVFRFGNGAMLAHLGMSGSFRIVEPELAPRPHDHVDIAFGARVLRYHDPRRFGSVHWCGLVPESHPLLASLGPEPLDDHFDGRYLKAMAESRQVAIKIFIMNAKVVVGVGNIYASEALFRAGIHPSRPAHRVSLGRYEALAKTIKEVLAEAIKEGGTTLRDFVSSDGAPGYFAHSLRVYDREGQPCVRCDSTVRKRVLGQRATYFCAGCQR